MIDVGGDDLLRLNVFELRQLVAQLRGLFELQTFRGCLHAAAEVLAHLIVAALQHLDRRAHVACVALLGNESHAGSRAALDLVLQARPRPIREIGVVAISQAKKFLQLLQSLTHRAGRWVRPEVPPRLLARSAIKSQARKFMLCFEMQVGKALVVAQHHIEARPMLFYEIEFEQQRFRVGIRDGDFHADRLRDQRLNLRMHIAGLKVRSDSGFEIARLADVENFSLCIQHPVNARTGRQTVDVDPGFECRRGRRRRVSQQRIGCVSVCVHPSRASSAMSRALPTTPSNMEVVSRRVWVL